MINGVQSRGQICSPSPALIPGTLHEDEVAAVEQAGDQGQQVAGEVLGTELIASAHQKRRASGCETQGQRLPP